MTAAMADIIPVGYNPQVSMISSPKKKPEKSSMMSILEHDMSAPNLHPQITSLAAL
jgi:hypothetical protein